MVGQRRSIDCGKRSPHEGCRSWGRLFMCRVKGTHGKSLYVVFNFALNKTALKN